MSGFKAGESFFRTEEPKSDEAIRMKYRSALAAGLSMLERSIKLAVKAEDQTGLKSLKDAAMEMFTKADNTLRYGPNDFGIVDDPGTSGTD